MTFAVFADGTANLPGKLLEGIRLLPSELTINGTSYTYTGDIENFDMHSYYEGLRHGDDVKTSLLNTSLFMTSFEPLVKEGTDIIYVAMSSGISGTYNAACVAAMQLMEEYPERYIHIVDSHGCGFGNGMLAIKAAELSKEGISSREAGQILDDMVPHCCQYFTVDDLNFLKRTGRVSGATAMIATTLQIKPILYGDHTGHIVSCENCRGRKRAIQKLADKYSVKRMDLPTQTVYISHGDCLQDAEKLRELILSITPDVTVVLCPHEPFSGAHVGPGMLGLFFLGKER
ncbi:MAG: DegV family protein [Solobacterium sp.]|nr:DegV family protein [Solobacterium sp.]